MKSVDVAIIGAGSAGMTAHRAARKHGARVLSIEGGAYGTTCARVGCMPSKLLIAAADAAHEIGVAEQLGIRVEGGIRIDGRAVLERVRRERDRFVGGVVSSIEQIPDEEKLRGAARFVGPTSLDVTTGDGDEVERVEAKAVVIATGSAPWHPPPLAAAADRLMSNDDVFELEQLPRSLAVVGSGVIGLELGQAMSRLGVRTSLFSIDDMLGPMTDPRVKRTVREQLGAELDLSLEVRIESVKRVEGGVELSWTDPDGKAHCATFERLLAATGRRPRVADLGLEAAGVELGRGGVPKFDERTMQCGTAPLFIVGDANGQRPLLHEAADEGHIAGTNAALFPEVQAHPRRTPLAIVFSDPQMAIVGRSHAELVAAGVDFEVGEVSYANQGRATVMGRNAGRVHIYGKLQCGSILGAEMFGPRVEHTAHLLAWAAQTGMCVGNLLGMPFYHPVIEEGIRTALRDLARKLKMRCARDPLCESAGA